MRSSDDSKLVMCSNIEPFLTWLHQFPIRYGTGNVKLQRETDKIEVSCSRRSSSEFSGQIDNVTMREVTFGVSVGESRFPFAMSPADGICG